MSVENVSKKFGHQTVLSNVSLSMDKGEWLSLLGPSGCGKTTLLRILAGIEPLDNGRIILEGNDITATAPAKRRMGMVFQSYALFPNLTVEDNVLYGLSQDRISREEKISRAEEVLLMVGLIPERSKYPSQLSGGQQQRTALARTLIKRPQLLLLDEPFSALDAQVRLSIRKELRQLQQKLGITTILVTHDQEEALTLSDKVAVIDDGHIVQHGAPRDIYEHPSTPFVAGFIGAMNFVDLPGMFELNKQPLPVSLAENSIFAIRPEHLRLSSGGGAVNARIITKEYRGSFYRLCVEIDRRDSSPSSIRLEIDMTAAEFDQCISYGSDIIPIEVDHKKFISFA